MTLGEFKLHRPFLGRMLQEIVDDHGLPETGWSIRPRYDNEVLFEAELMGHSPGLTCVGPKHPRTMIEETSPSSRGTWWWNDDLAAEER